MPDTARIMDTNTEPDPPKIKLGVSACLLGEPVRYDGNHKRHSFLTDVLAAYVDYLPVCPEAGVGMGVPRPPIQLVGQPGKVRALGVDNPAMDVTDRLQGYAQQQCRTLTTISGYIFKKDSPSCGLGKVKLFKRPGHDMQRKGTGVYADTLVHAAPLLPVTEEDCFDDPKKRNHFLEQAYTYRRWQELTASGVTTKLLLDFHATHRYLIMAHSQAAYHKLGKLLGDLPEQPLKAVSESYISMLMQTLKRPSQQHQCSNVLQRIANDLKQELPSAEHASLVASVEGYLAGSNNLFSVLKVLNQRVCRNPRPDHAVQLFLHPYPESLQNVTQGAVSGN